jgi:transposase
MQINGLHKNVYKLAAYAGRAESLSEEAAIRHKLLGHWETLKARRVPDRDIAQVTGISRTTYYRRKAVIRSVGLRGLERRSRRPRQVRQSGIAQTTRELVMRLRRDHPTYGKVKLTVILARDHGIALSESSVGRILTDFMARGLILRYAAATRRARVRRFTGHAQRKAYELRPKEAGDLIQVDHMTVTKNTNVLKHFQAWDPLTKYTFADVYSNAKSISAAKFLDGLQQALPFPIRSIQVDGGSEFMKEFEQACKDKGVPLYVLPPKRPQYNGGVERMNRTMREDFYARKDLLAEDLTEFREAVRKATHTYNHFRPHQRLDNLTPAEYVATILKPQSVPHVLN